MSRPCSLKWRRRGATYNLYPPSGWHLAQNPHIRYVCMYAPYCPRGGYTNISPGLYFRRYYFTEFSSGCALGKLRKVVPPKIQCPGQIVLSRGPRTLYASTSVDSVAVERLPFVIFSYFSWNDLYFKVSQRM